MNRLLTRMHSWPRWLALGLTGWLLTACAHNEAVDPDREAAFLKIYGTAAAQQALGIVQLSNGDFLLAAAQETDTNEQGLLIVATEPDGTLIWERTLNSVQTGFGQTYRNFGEDEGFISQVTAGFGSTETLSGQLMLNAAGQPVLLTDGYTDPAQSQTRQLLAITLNPTDGSVAQALAFGPVTDEDRFAGANLTASGDLLVIGTQRNSELALTSDMLGLSSTPEGTLLWQETYGTIGNVNLGNSIVEGSNGALYWLGLVGAVDDEAISNLRLTRTDANGVSLWDRRFPEAAEYTALNQFPQQLLAIPNGLMIIGLVERAGQSDITFTQVSLQGQQLANSEINTPSNEAILAAIPTSDGGFALLGAQTPATLDETSLIYLLKTDAAGQPEWERTFGSSGLNVGASLLQTDDGGFAIAASLQLGGNDHLCFIKTDAMGQLQ